MASNNASAANSVPDRAEVEQRILKHSPRYRWTADDVVKGVDLQGKYVIVTGATSGIGIPTARALARTGCNLVITARDAAKGSAVLAELKPIAAAAGGSVTVGELDLVSFTSVKKFADWWRSTHPEAKLHVLLHNAGIMATPLVITEDGFEQQLQVNFLSVALLTRLLTPTLTKGSRVVVVSSAAHRTMPPGQDFAALLEQYSGIRSSADESYNKWVAYAVAKSASISLAKGLDQQLGSASSVGAHAYSLHPGGIATSLARDLEAAEREGLFNDRLTGLVLKTEQQGAATSVWAAVSSELEGHGGAFLDNVQIIPDGKTAEDEVLPFWALPGQAVHVSAPESIAATVAKADEVIAAFLAKK